MPGGLAHFGARWLLLWLLGAPLAAAQAEDTLLAIVAHPADHRATLDAGTLAGIFRRVVRVDALGRQLVPVNLPADDALRVAFSQALFKMSPEEMEAYWNERYFHGVPPPHVVASVEAMLRFVSAIPGAVGYVPLCVVDRRVQIIARLAVAAEQSAMNCPPPPSNPTKIAD